jgi:hypothetical protein
MYSGASGLNGLNAASGSNTGSRAWPANGLSTIGGANRQQIQGIANVGNYKAQEDWWFFIPAIIFVDTFVIFLCRFYPQTFGKPINQWYDEFGLAAVLSDVTIIAIGIAITRYIYTVFFMEQEGWSIWYFIGLAILIQLVHDLAFAFGVVAKIPKGHNSMIDVFKAYVEGGPIILLSDALMVAGSIGIAAALKNQDFHYTSSFTLVTLYALSYILFTNIKL